MQITLATLNAKFIHVNLALRYLRALLKPEFPAVRLAEYTLGEPLSEVAWDLARTRPQVVAFSCYIWNMAPTLHLADLLRRILPETVILLGGPEVSFEAEDLLRQNPAVDAILPGESETLFLAVCRRLAAVPDLARLREALYETFAATARPVARERAQHPGACAFPPLEPTAPPALLFAAPMVLPDLSQLPPPYADMPEELPSLAGRTVYYETSRGCPFRCSFCLSSTTRGVRFFPLERVQSELQLLVDAGVTTIKFCDRTFNADAKRALTLWRFLAELAEHHHIRRPRAPWPRFYFEITATTLTPPLLRFLRAEAPPGLFQLEIGVQSSDPEVNRRVGRRQDFARLADHVAIIRRGRRARVHLDLIAGLPGEGYASFARSFDAAMALHPDELQIEGLKLLKGTQLRSEAERWGYLWDPEPPYAVLQSAALSYWDLRRLLRVAEMVDRYYNAGIGWWAADWLVEAGLFSGPFALYQALADLWEEKGWYRLEPARPALYDRLAEFARDVLAKAQHGGPAGGGAASEAFWEWLGLDWFSQEAGHKPPAWCPPLPLPGDAQRRWAAALSEAWRDAEGPEGPPGPRRILQEGLFLATTLTAQALQRAFHIHAGSGAQQILPASPPPEPVLSGSQKDAAGRHTVVYMQYGSRLRRHGRATCWLLSPATPAPIPPAP